ncbi:hypothetical protein H696_05330 [Fonticula alba]|uniref:Transmembrane protein 65 n=1 Tax=Fonticula alba TaxID=691883 RepID=A0A058Z2D0_FONAL|nr:hypothetical protein H696_05330 [Fonticula alba]KCV68078.1 hypothetical protein H696_05330 [Fonticula alba]|eukprot:XP_009497452.1 hypothetical protein H696_05330 [Fonticula alba]
MFLSRVNGPLRSFAVHGSRSPTLPARLIQTSTPMRLSAQPAASASGIPAASFAKPQELPQSLARALNTNNPAQVDSLLASLDSSALAALHAGAERRMADMATAAESLEVVLSVRQRTLHFLRSALPFVGFGFLDNAIMLVAGDKIDTHFGVFLGISTLASAALGNALANVTGIAFGQVIESALNRLGVPDPKMSAQQLASATAARYRRVGNVFGILVGCLLGMMPLLFMNTEPRLPSPLPEGVAGLVTTAAEETAVA